MICRKKKVTIVTLIHNIGSGSRLGDENISECEKYFVKWEVFSSHVTKHDESDENDENDENGQK